jgi:hypothetical protein
MYAHIMKQAHDIELICVVVEWWYKIIFTAYVEYGDIVYESLWIHTYSIDALHTLLCRFYPQKKNCLGNILRALLYEPSRVIGGDSNSEDENER